MKNTDATALRLFSKLKDVKFIETVYILAELLPYLSNLSKASQRGTVDFSRIAPTIEYTKEKLEEAAETKSPINWLKADLLDTGRLGILDMNASLHHLQVLENLLSNYVNALKANIDSRFKESLPVVSAWSVSDPLKVPSKEHPSFKTYGKNQVHALVQHFTSAMPSDKKHSVGDELKTEFAKLK